MSLDYRDVQVHRYGYRQAMATNRLFSLQYDHGDAVCDLQQELAERANSSPDNHETYTLTKEDGSMVAIQFSDWVMYVGTAVDVRSW